MYYYRITVAVIAGICLGFGMLFLFVGLRRKTNKRLNYTFSLFALCYATTLLFGVRWYSATSVSEFLSVNRYDALFVVGAFVGLIWYVAIYTGVRPRLFLVLLTVLYVITGVARIAYPDAFLGSINGLKTLELPWGESLTLLDSTGSIWAELFVVAQLVSLGFFITALTLQYIRGARTPALILALGILPFVAAILYEILGESGLVPYIPLGEVGFVGFAIAASLQMANSVIRTEEELSDYQENLEIQVKERTAELQVANQLLVVQERDSAAIEERRRIAAELHDSVTQTLYSISIVAAAIPRLLERNLEEAKRSAQHLRNMSLGALAEMRTLLYELRPESFESSNLATLLQQAADVFTGRTHIPVQLTVQESVSLTPDVNLAFYRIAQEGLNNIGKHAAASVVILSLTEVNEVFVLTLRDNGKGFNQSSAAQQGQGLSIMSERASIPGFSLDVTSATDVGTTITATWREGTVDDQE